jgi:hypothetical protein
MSLESSCCLAMMIHVISHSSESSPRYQRDSGYGGRDSYDRDDSRGADGMSGYSNARRGGGDGYGARGSGGRAGQDKADREDRDKAAAPREQGFIKTLKDSYGFVESADTGLEVRASNLAVARAYVGALLSLSRYDPDLLNAAQQHFFHYSEVRESEDRLRTGMEVSNPASRASPPPLSSHDKCMSRKPTEANVALWTGGIWGVRSSQRGQAHGSQDDVVAKGYDHTRSLLCSRRIRHCS